MPSITGHAVGKNGAHPTSQHAKTTTTSKSNRNINHKILYLPIIEMIAVERDDTTSNV